MDIPLWRVDAFTARPFAGNPAAVCPLERWLPDDVLRAIAAENNLAATAFFVRRADGDFDLRWLTPTVELDLCGHATLASAWTLTREIEPARSRVVFHTKSGPLVATRDGEEIAMDLPARPAEAVATPPAFARALGATPAACVQARALVGVFERAEDVRAIAPDMEALAALDGVETAAVTAPGTGADADVDFVSRYFAPRKGIPEDPVTGALHVTLAPYWAARLGKKTLRARQVSARGGEIGCVLREDGRVVLKGRAVVVMRGTVVV